MRTSQGLRVDHSPFCYKDIRGIERARWFVERLCAGPERPQVILRIDEIEKKLAGSGADEHHSGSTGADELQVLLTMMEDEGWSGVIAYGHPGTCKTMWTRASGPTFGIQTLELDLGATRSKFVGESEAHIREALRTVKAVGGRRVYVMATANDLASLRPELKRRFTDGVFFFDLPTAEERADLWKLYIEKYGLTHTGRLPDDKDWTGAEIRNACWLAHRLQVPLSEAALEIIPVAKADWQSIERRRQHADRRYRDAAKPGHFTLADGTGTGTARGFMTEE